MAYEQYQSDIAKEQERRKLVRQALIDNIAPSQTQMVSGRAVPYSPIQGLSQIAKALIYKNSLSDSDAREATARAAMEGEKKQAISDVMSTYTGRDANPLTDITGAEVAGPYTREDAPIEANPEKAAIMAAGNSYTSDISPVITAMMKSKYSAKNSGGNPYHTQFIGRDGNAYDFNNRTGEATPLNLVAGKLDPVTQANIAGAKQQATSDVDVVMKPEIKKQTDLAVREAKKIIDKPKTEGALGAAETKTGMLGELFKQAKDQTSGWTTGVMNALTGWIPGSPSADLNSTLTTIKSNIGFDKLQEMRDNSPTGGALGQVSEFENKLLQAVWGDLNASTSKEQFERNLERVEKQVNESWNRVREAYKKDYGVEYGKAPQETKVIEVDW